MHSVSSPQLVSLLFLVLPALATALSIMPNSHPFVPPSDDYDSTLSQREYREVEPDYEEFNPPRVIHIVTTTAATATTRPMFIPKSPLFPPQFGRGNGALPFSEQNDPARIVGSTDLAKLSAQLTLGLDNDRLSFRSNEYFVLFNPHKKTCLSVRETRVRKRVKLATERCNLNQSFRKDSPLTFFWIPVENNLAVLGQRRGARVLCARHGKTGTWMEPCGPKSTRYSLSTTKHKGTFKVKDAGINKARCMDAEFHHALRMKKCGGFRDQAWQKIFVSY